MKIVCKFARFSNILEAWPSVHVPVCATAIVAVGGAGKGNGVLRMKWQVWAWELCLALSAASGTGDRKCRFSATCVWDLLLLLLADVITMAQSQALLLRDCYLHVAVFLAGTIISILWLWLVIMTIVTLARVCDCWCLRAPRRPSMWRMLPGWPTPGGPGHTPPASHNLLS